MMISPVSFGRAVKVNTSLQGAQHAVDLINSESKKRGESKVQQKLKDVFFDSGEGILASKLMSIDGRTYIFSGQENIKVEKLKQDRDIQLAAAMDIHGDKSSAYEMVKECEDARYLDLLKCLVEPIELDVRYQNKKHKIKSVNVII